MDDEFDGGDLWEREPTSETEWVDDTPSLDQLQQWFEML